MKYIRKYWIISSAALLYLILNLIYLTKYLTVWIDDNLFSEPAWIYSTAGRLVALGGWAGDEKVTMFIEGRLFYLPRIILFKLTGVLSPYTARIPSLLCGMISLVLMYVLAKKFFNRKIALVSTGFLACSQNFIAHSHDNRPETMLLMFLLASLLVFFASVEKNSAFLWFITGLIAALSIDIQLSGLLIFLMILGLSVKYRRKIIFRKFLFIAFGILAGFIWWAGTRLSISSLSVASQWHNVYTQRMPPVLDLHNPSGYFLRVSHTFYTFFWEGRKHRNMFLLAVWLAAVLYSLFRREEGQKVFLNLLLSCLVFFLFLSGNNSSAYLIYSFPFLYVLAVKMAHDLLHDGNNIKKIAGIALFSGLGLFYALESGYILYVYPKSDYYGFIKKVIPYVPARSVVYGNPEYWYGFTNNGFAFYQRYKTEDMGLGETVRRRNIDYILYNRTAEQWRGDTESLEYLTDKCKLVGTVRDSFYGGPLNWAKGDYTTEIYRVIKDKRIRG